MELDLNPTEAPDPRRLRSRVFLCVYVAVFLFAILIGMSAHNGSRPASRVRLTIDTNGVVSMAGLRLSNPGFRHDVYTTLHVIGVKVTVGSADKRTSLVPNWAGATNYVNSLQEISKAGLFNKP